MMIRYRRARKCDGLLATCRCGGIARLSSLGGPSGGAERHARAGVPVLARRLQAGQTAGAVAPQALLRLIGERLLNPQGLTRARIECLDESDSVRAIETPLTIHGVARKSWEKEEVRFLAQEATIDGWPSPGDAQPRDIAFVDLIERCVLSAAQVSAVPPPLTAAGPLLRKGCSRRDHNDRKVRGE
jgi:hypothetical protein